MYSWNCFRWSKNLKWKKLKKAVDKMKIECYYKQAVWENKTSQKQNKAIWIKKEIQKNKKSSWQMKKALIK